MKPNKGLGQHFLVDKRALEKVVAAANIQKSDVILEIGPGTGLLTKELASRAHKVITIEKDERMIKVLKETLEDYKNIEIIQGDALKLSITNFQLSNYKVVANIPYYITSPLIRKFLESAHRPSEIILMVQKEVAKRICAKVPDMNLLAVSVQFYAKPKIISYISKGSFWPAPKIDSAIIKITPQINADKKRIDADKFFTIVKAGFLHPRKKLINNLTEGLTVEKERVQAWLLENSIDPNRRAETISMQEWEGLTQALDKSIVKPQGSK